MQHRGGDRDDVGPGRSDLDDLVGEHAGPAGRLRQLDTGHRVERAGPVQVVEFVVFGGAVAITLAGNAVHDHRAAELASTRECGLDRRDVVPVDRPDVLQAKILEKSLRRKDILEPALDAVQRVEQRIADERRARQNLAHLLKCLLVARIRAQRREVLGETADRLGVRAAVVVDEHDNRVVLRRGDVVERFPAHAAGERTVADDRHDGSLLTAHRERLRETIGVTTAPSMRGSSRPSRARIRRGSDSPRGRRAGAASRTLPGVRSTACARRPDGRCRR